MSRNNLIGSSAKYYKKDFWEHENQKYAGPHYRLRKIAGLVNKIADGQPRSLFDVGCGPAALRGLLRPGIDYYGADIAIRHPAPYLREADFIDGPVRFDGRTFDIIVAQGFFEYAGHLQSRMFGEIAQILAPGGVFVTTYVNFAHRNAQVYWPYSNVQPAAQFRAALAEHFRIQRSFPTSHNWRQSEPNRRVISAVNMRLNFTVPLVSRRLAVEYIYVCGHHWPVSSSIAPASLAWLPIRRRSRRATRTAAGPRWPRTPCRRSTAPRARGHACPAASP